MNATTQVDTGSVGSIAFYIPIYISGTEYRLAINNVAP
jgi:hypothetical protein